MIIVLVLSAETSLGLVKIVGHQRDSIETEDRLVRITIRYQGLGQIIFFKGKCSKNYTCTSAFFSFCAIACDALSPQKKKKKEKAVGEPISD